MFETGLGAGDAGKTGIGTSFAARPDALVTVACGLRGFAAQMLHHAACLTKGFGACLELVKLVP